MLVSIKKSERGRGRGGALGNYPFPKCQEFLLSRGPKDAVSYIISKKSEVEGEGGALDNLSFPKRSGIPSFQSPQDAAS